MTDCCPNCSPLKHKFHVAYIGLPQSLQIFVQHALQHVRKIPNIIHTMRRIVQQVAQLTICTCSRMYCMMYTKFTVNRSEWSDLSDVYIFNVLNTLLMANPHQVHRKIEVVDLAHKSVQQQWNISSGIWNVLEALWSEWQISDGLSTRVTANEYYEYWMNTELVWLAAHRRRRQLDEVSVRFRRFNEYVTSRHHTHRLQASLYPVMTV